MGIALSQVDEVGGRRQDRAEDAPEKVVDARVDVVCRLHARQLGQHPLCTRVHGWVRSLVRRQRLKDSDNAGAHRRDPRGQLARRLRPPLQCLLNERLRGECRDLSGYSSYLVSLMSLLNFLNQVEKNKSFLRFTHLCHNYTYLCQRTNR